MLREFRLPTLQNSLDMRSLICFAVKLPTHIFVQASQFHANQYSSFRFDRPARFRLLSYMTQRFPTANIFHSGISRPAISRRHIFLYRANLSLSLATTFRQGAFGACLNLMAFNISLSFSIFFLFFLFFIFLVFLLLSVFLAFFPHSLSSNIPNFYFFRIFLRISARKNSIHHWML